MLSRKNSKDVEQQFMVIGGHKCHFVNIEGKSHIIINGRVHKLFMINEHSSSVLAIKRICKGCKEEFFSRPEDETYRCTSGCSSKFQQRKKGCKINNQLTKELIQERRIIREQSKGLIRKKITRNRKYKLDGDYMVVEGKECKIHRMRQKGGLEYGKLIKYIERQCLHCGKEFYTRTTKPSKFCSISCGAKHNKSNFVNKRVTNTCDEKKKALAQMRMYRLVTSGKIIRPSICSSCGSSNKIIRPHHENYDEIYTVVWLCRSCNCLLQYGNNVKGTTIKYDSDGTILETNNYERNIRE